MAEDSAVEPEGSWSEILIGPYAPYTYVLSLGMALYALKQFVVATIMPTVVADLGGLDYYTWAFSLFAVGAIIGAASAGPLREAFGARLPYVGAGLVFALGLGGAAMATDMPTLVGWRLVQGIGGGALASQAYGLIAIIYPPHLRSRVLAVTSTVWGVATVGGPGFGAAFAQPGLWRFAFWSVAPLALVFAALAWRYIEGGRGHGRLSEIPYQRLALLGLAVLVVSATSLSDENWLRGLLLILSLALAALAFVRDARAERAMFPRQAMAIATELGGAYWILLLISIVMTVVNTYATFYLQALHGVSPITAGYLFAVQSFAWTGSALYVATLRMEHASKAIVVGLVLVLLSSIGVVLTVDSGPVIAIAIAIAFNGAGIGFINNPVIQRVIAVAPEAERHIAGTSVQVVRNIAVAFGAAIAGMVAAAAGLTDGADRAAVAGAMEWVYGVNVGFAVLAVAMVVPLIARHRSLARM